MFKDMKGLILTPLLLLLISNEITCSRILGLFPYEGKSHFHVSGALLKGLAKRGHQVVVLTHHPLKDQLPNYTDISLVDTVDKSLNSLNIEDTVSEGVSGNIWGIIKLGIDACEASLASTAVQNLIKSEEKFDLIITEFFNTDCILGFVHKFKVPYIAIGTSVILPWTNSRFGNPDNPSYMPSQFSKSSDKMTFYERLMNFLYQESLKFVYDIFIMNPSQKIANKYFGEPLPPLFELARNASLLLMNTHFTITKPRPFVPSIVEVAGMHISEPQELPKDLKKFLDEATHGVIYMSLGSQARIDSISSEKLRSFVQVFSSLPQRALWKWEGEQFPGQPRNVMTAKWLPQSDVLCHPAVRVFVTHAGLLGTIEAVNCGVPMLTIPLFGDQYHNAECLVTAGVARMITYKDITENVLFEALSDLIHNSTYKENAKRLQKSFRDRPMPPLETAIFWTEYIIRHGGTSHMRSAAMDLYWFQYLLLDVIVVIILSVLILIYICYKAICLFCCTEKGKRDWNKFKKNK